MSISATAMALCLVGLTLTLAGAARVVAQTLRGAYLDKRASAWSAIGFFMLAVSAWLIHNWPAVGFDAFFCALHVVAWWKSGGDDDWRKRRRQLRDWARSHVPRPTVVQIRPLATVPS